MVKKMYWKQVAMIIMAAAFVIHNPVLAEENIETAAIEETAEAAAETEAPETEAPAAETEAPETEAPEPETEAPQTEAPEPETEAPAPETEAPQTEAPAAETEAPQTEAPAPETEAPQTEAPAPETEAPQTEAPAPETEAPQTEAPAPETEAPQTEAPAPETEAPQTEAPAPETEAPQTEAPAAETEAPQTEISAPEAEAPETEEASEDAEASQDEETEKVSYKKNFVYEDDEVIVTAKASRKAKFPENTEIRVRKLAEGTAEFEAAKQAAAAGTGASESAEYKFYDVTFAADGNEITPADGKVSVTIQFKTVQVDAEAEIQKVLQIGPAGANDVTAPGAEGSNISSVKFNI